MLKKAIDVPTFFRQPGEGGDDVGQKIGETASRVMPCRVLDAAIGLLPHLEEAVNGVFGVGVVDKSVALRILRRLLERSGSAGC
jgi:hypothetical protein